MSRIADTFRRLLWEEWGYTGKVWVGLGTAIALAGGGLIYQQVTNGPPSDVTPPTVTLTAPTDSTTVSGTIAVSATASDNVGVSFVEFLRNGVAFNTDNAAPYTVNFDTTSVANGSHTFTARAQDAASNSTTSNASTVTVSNGGACVFPTCFPDVSNTGVPAGTNLTAYTGPTTITTNNTVIDSKSLTNGLQIEATGVVIRNSLFNMSSQGGVFVEDTDANYTRSSNGTQFLVTIEDSTIDCHGDASGGPTGAAEAHIHLIRVEIADCENGLSINQNVTIEDSLIHDLDNIGTDTHEDGIQFSFGYWNGSTYVCCARNIVIRHTTIISMAKDSLVDFGTSAIISNKNGPDVNVLIEKNLLMGGGYTLYCDQLGIKGTNYHVDNNHFSTQFFPNVGYLGPSSDCADEDATGNVIHETGAPLSFAGDGG